MCVLLISLHAFPSFPHLTSILSFAVFLRFLLGPFLTNLSTLTHLLYLSISPTSIRQSTFHPPSFSIHWFCPLFFSSSLFSSHLRPLFSSHRLFLYLFLSITMFVFFHYPGSFFSVRTTLPLALHTSSSSALPLADVGIKCKRNLFWLVRASVFTTVECVHLLISSFLPQGSSTQCQSGFIALHPFQY